jgi:hypothetical protein
LSSADRQFVEIVVGQRGDERALPRAARLLPAIADKTQTA